MSPPDPVAYVVSRNLHRRHLTQSQRGLCAGKVKKWYEAEAKKRQMRKPTNSVQAKLPEQTGQARDLAGKAVGVSGRYVDYGETVLEHGEPELVKAVEDGRVSVATALAAVHKP